MLANRHVQLHHTIGTKTSGKVGDGPPCQMMKLKFARQKKKDWATKGIRPGLASPKCSFEQAEACVAVSWSLSTQPDDEAQARVLYFYAQEVAIDLAGEVESAFWQVYVLQRHHQEPVIRQAIIALASTYWEERQASRTAVAPLPITSAQQMNKAVIKLRKYIRDAASPSYSVVLSCALLLFALDRLRGDDQAALCHLDNSILIFDAWRSQLAGQITAEFGLLHATLARLDGNATIQDMMRVPKLGHLSTDLQQPLRFDTTEQMQDWLTVHGCQPLLRIGSQTINGIITENAAAEKLQYVEKALCQWRGAADCFSKSRSHTLREELAILACESHYLTCKATLDDALGHTSSWDESLDDVWKVAQRAVEIQQTLRGSGEEKRWSLNVGVTQPFLRFVKNATIEPMRSNVLEKITAYEAYQDYPPICPSIGRA